MPSRVALLFLSLISLLCLLPKAAFAACTTPTGTEGEFFYNVDFKVMQFCDGTNWMGMTGGADAGGGSGITDGDKGDVTVSGSGATWTVDSSSVTYAKIQDVSAANTILGRATAGAGVVEEITLGSGLTLTGSTLSASGTASGTAGYIQFSGGSGAFASSSTTAGQQFFWDETNHRLGIGLEAPTQAVDVVGKVTANSMILKLVNGAAPPTGGSTAQWTTDGTHVWRATGNVGIGTATPASILHIVNTSTPSPRNIVSDQVNAGTDGPQINTRKARGTPSSLAAVLTGDVLLNLSVWGHDGTSYANTANVVAIAEQNFTPSVHDSYLSFRTTSGTTVVDRMRISSTGNVGIGTTTPSSSLHVVGGILVRGGAPGANGVNNNGYAFGAGGDSDSGIFSSADGQVEFYSNAGEVMRIVGGNVGVGTTAPTAKMEVMNLISGLVTGLRVIPVHVPGVVAGVKLNAEDQGGTARDIFLNTSGGYVAVGGTGSVHPSYTLQSYGTVAGAAAYVNTSDARLKKDVADLDYGLATVERLRPVSFQWKEQTEDWQKGRKLGLIAQETEAVVPEVVTTANDAMGTKSIAYGDLTPILIKAVQELKADNDNLRAEFEAYKAAHP